jgi:N-acetylglucosamine-6-sulfatase
LHGERSPSPLAFLVGAAASISVLWSAAAVPPSAHAVVPPPNVIIVMTDDQRWDSISPTLTPVLENTLVADGMRFENAFAPNPLCCPSRTSTLTGNYSHTTGVYSNGGKHGGFLSFYYTGGDESTIATDFRAAGYRTALVGKYLNGYPRRRFWRYVPPGWDQWFSISTSAYYDYRAADNGRRSPLFGGAPRDYSTRVLTQRAVDFIDRSLEAADPFFLYFAPTAPHAPATPDPRDVGRFEAEVAAYQHPPSYRRLLPDQPSYLADAKADWNPAARARTTAFHELQLEAAFGVDRALRRLVRSVGTAPTIILFMSDNGMLWGEHYWRGKVVPYEESIRIPMVLWSNVPGLVPHTVDPDPVLNVDLRETLEGLVGDGSVVRPDEPTDGVDIFATSVADRHFPLEQEQLNGVPSYCGVRTADGWMFTHYETGEEELYHGAAADGSPIDPYELDNLAPTRLEKTAELRTEARVLCVREPPEFSWGS